VTYAIRRADPDDIDTLTRLRLDFVREVGTLATDDPATELAEAIRRYLLEHLPGDDFAVWVAEVGDQVVATAWLVFFDRPPMPWSLAGREALVLNVYTISDWRDQGIATALMEEIIRFVRATDAGRIQLRTTEAGEPVYRKVGFVPATSAMEMML
jgi:GNAT superfamily N-acetyltransferase